MTSQVEIYNAIRPDEWVSASEIARRLGRRSGHLNHQIGALYAKRKLVRRPVGHPESGQWEWARA